MPSKKKNKGGGDGSNNNNDDDLKQEGNVKLQAVLLADAAFGSAVTSREGYQSFGLRPWSSEESTGGSQVLCPINNVPIVEYILDFLSSNGVEQVIVVIGSGGSGNGTALEDYLEAKNLDSGKRSHRPEILVLKDTSLSNAGDALRELYKRNWIRASKQALPFLLVGGDVVADLDLTEAMRAHKDRNAKDAAAVMTVVLKPVRSTTPEGNATTTTTRPSIVPRVSDLVVGLVGASSKTIATADAQGKDADASAAAGDHRDFRVLYYDNNNNSGGSGSGTATIPCAFLGQSQTASTGPAACGGLVLRDDLLDTGIAICSPDVLGKLEDEFDYLDLAHDFVANSVAEEEDGLQTRIYAHVLDDPSSSSSERGGGRRGYAARAVDFQTYHAISQDLLRRWAYPAVADHRPPAAWEKERRYELAKVADHSRRGARPLRSLDNDRKATDASAAKPTGIRNNQYQYKEVRNPTKCGRTSVVVGPGMTGSGGSVGEGCFVARCVLGDDVTIGDGVRLVDCHLMDGVTIGDGAALESTVVASKASVGAGAVLGPGCFLGAGCSVGKGVTVKPFSRITLATEDDDDDWGSSDSDDDDDDDDDSSDDDDDDENDAVSDAVRPDLEVREQPDPGPGGRSRPAPGDGRPRPQSQDAPPQRRRRSGTSASLPLHGRPGSRAALPVGVQRDRVPAAPEHAAFQARQRSVPHRRPLRRKRSGSPPEALPGLRGGSRAGGRRLREKLAVLALLLDEPGPGGLGHAGSRAGRGHPGRGEPHGNLAGFPLRDLPGDAPPGGLPGSGTARDARVVPRSPRNVRGREAGLV
mmetsp:Transcript_20563/g.48447  ORF Transcript_20563/g.48447 Transcript_20563/m.48447 type:complete len:811 (-) Transcript_20563:627-3059(-)